MDRRIERLAAACLAVAVAGCGGKSSGGRLADGGDAPSAEGSVGTADGDGSTDVGGGDGAADASGDAVSTGDAGIDAVSEVTAQYRACVAYFRAECNRQSVCGGGGISDDPCPTITDSCPDIEFAPGSLRTVDTLLACAQAWTSFPCNDFLAGRSPSCAGIAGSLPEGAPCTISLQCAGKLCGTGNDAQHPNCGTCATRAVTGTACGALASCQNDEACIGGACVKFTQDRQLGESCGGAIVCAAPNRCMAGGDGGSTCQAVPKLGDPCTGIVSCADSLCTSAHLCEAWPTEGMPCKRDEIFNRFMCGAAFTCDESAAGGPTCIPRPGAGAACKTTGALEQSSCAAGLVCGCPDGTGTCGTGMCVRRRQEGDTCGAINDLCVPGTKCIGGRCSAVSRGVMTARCGP